MASTLPTPLAAALGLLPAALDRARRVPGLVLRFPVVALGHSLTTYEQVRKEYDDLADRGERLVARLRGQTAEAADAVAQGAAGAAGGVSDLMEGAPFATVDAPLAAVTTLADAAAARAGQAASSVASTASTAASTAASAVSPQSPSQGSPAADESGASAGAGTTGSTGTDSTDSTSTDGTSTDTADVPEAERPKGVPTPKATEPETTRVDSAAAPSVVQAVDQAVAESGVQELAHDELPLPDYDHMTLGSLRGRMRSLSVQQLVQIRTYEKAHADRLPIVTMLDNRIAKLAADPSATPSGPVSTEPAPEQRASAAAGGRGSAVSPATTNAPTINPPSHGDPTNPAQPR